MIEYGCHMARFSKNVISNHRIKVKKCLDARVISIRYSLVFISRKKIGIFNTIFQVFTVIFLTIKSQEIATKITCIEPHSRQSDHSLVCVLAKTSHRINSSSIVFNTF